MAIQSDLRFEIVEGWEQLPAGMIHRDVSGVACDSQDRVYLLTRDDARVIVYDRKGKFLMSWGENEFTPRTHGITIGPDDSVYCTDDGDHTVRKFTPAGKLLMMIGTNGLGTKDAVSDTGYDGKNTPSIKRAGPPFNRPTNVAIAPNGDLYVSDGYGNARVHRFTAEGKLIQSWGEPGTGPGQFNLPHGILVLADGRVIVADRENDRLEFFSPDGEYLDQWTNVQRPTDIAIGGDGLLYVSELWWRPGMHSFTHGDITENLPGRVSVYDQKGSLITRWGGVPPEEPGNFCAPHDLWVDSHGDLYVGEVTYTFGVKPGQVAPDCHMFQKFARKG